MPMKLDGFNFDRGIDRILHGNSLGLPLPASGQLLPTEAVTRPELERLLSLTNLQDFLAGALRPEIENKTLLTPPGFHLALRNCLAGLHKQAAGLGDKKGKALIKAAAILDEEANLRDLLQMYRSALYQG